MKKIINFIVEKRIYLIITFTILFAFSFFLLLIDNTNYDLSSYLSDESNTKIVLDIMSDEFNSNGSFMIMTKNISKEDAINIKNKLSSIEGISFINYDENEDYKDDSALYVVYLEYTNYSNEAKKILNDVKKILSEYDSYYSGETVNSVYLSKTVINDMAIIMSIACAIVIIILFVNSISWVEPIIFIIVSIIAIIINMGTNSLLPQVSFITKSISPVMQLALSMDYSIILLHRFTELYKEDDDEKLIMKQALEDTLMPILGSGLTTIGGLLAIICMTFTLGADIGIVLTKGIILSLLSVLLLMPGITILFSKLIIKTRHRNIYQIIKKKSNKISHKVANYQYKTRYIYTIIFILIIPVTFYFYTKAEYSFVVKTSTNENSEIEIDKKVIEDIFGVNNTFAVIIPSESLEIEKEVVKLLEEYKYNGKKPFTNVKSIATTGIYDYLSYNEFSLKYNINLEMSKIIFTSIEENCTQDTKIQVLRILENLVDEKFLETLKENYQVFFSSSLEAIDLLDSVISCEGLLELLNNSLFTMEKCEYFLSTLPKNVITYSELIKYLKEEKYFNKYLSKIKDIKESYDILTKTRDIEEVNEYFAIDDQTIFVYPNNLSYYNFAKENEENENVKIKEVLSQYTKLLQMYTKNEAMNKEEFMLLPNELFSIAFAFNDTLSYYDICRIFTSSSLLEDTVNTLNEKIEYYYNLCSLFKESYTIDEFSSLMGISKDIINKYYHKDEITFKSFILVILEDECLNEIIYNIKESIEVILEKVRYAQKMFEGENYNRIVANFIFDSSTKEAVEVCDKEGIIKEIRSLTQDSYIVTNVSSQIDLRDAFKYDNIKINIISFVFIFVVLAISFKSLIIPIILTLVIEGSIWFTMSTNYFINNSAYFICYLLVVSIQMGVTIDYAILLTNKYKKERESSDIKEAIKLALSSALPTILTSGSILVVAAYLVYKFSSLSIISEIGFLLSKGSFISIIMIILFLPKLLCCFDKSITNKSSK